MEETEKIWVDKFLKNFGAKENVLLIGIIPTGGASWGRDAILKHWSKEKFAELADILIVALIDKCNIIISNDRGQPIYLWQEE